MGMANTPKERKAVTDVIVPHPCNHILKTIM